ncbi:MAG: SDR family NAD(P)-dependent oxidoreductase [Alphaproteobacteria bacterium]|nr:SDR family NAD(P)-dependent oxidoreductase [Alphaproteobacteria bacterium]
MKQRNVKNKNFVFVGGTQGMGKAAALALAERGASILVLGRNQAAGDNVVELALKNGANTAEFVQVDISTVQGIKHAVDKIKNWQPQIHGLMHSAMTGFNKKIITEDELEFGFALQYFGRAMIDELLVEQLAASGDGRIVHLSANIPTIFTKIDLDDLQFKTRKWGFYKSLLGSNHLSMLYLQQAAQRYKDLPISYTAACVTAVKTQIMSDPKMPLLMRLAVKLGTTAEIGAKNSIAILTCENSDNLKAVKLPSAKRFTPKKLAYNKTDAENLWVKTLALAREKKLIPMS